MALTGWSTSNYLTHAAGISDTRPLLISGWMYRTATAFKNAFAIGQAASNQHMRMLSLGPTDGVGALESDASGLVNAATSTTVPLATWSHGSAWFVGATLREALLDGGGLGTNATSRTPGASDVTRIGVSNTIGSPWDATGALAEMSVWDGTGFTAPERRALDTALAAGDNPLVLNRDGAAVWFGRLLAYWPLRSSTGLSDASGNGAHMSMVGTLTTFGSHPVIDSPGEIDTFLVVGYSNAQGQGDQAQSPAVVEGTAYEWDDTGFLDLDDPVANANTGSAWPSFANEYFSRSSRISAYVSKAVPSSTQLAAADGGFGNWSPTGAHFGTATTALDDAVDQLEALGWTVTTKGVLYDLGGLDALAENGTTITKATYKAALEVMIQDFRDLYGATLPFWIFQLGALDSGDTPDFADWRDAQAEVAAADANTGLAFTGAVNFPAEGKMSDETHYTQAGYNEYGATGALAVLGIGITGVLLGLHGIGRGFQPVAASRLGGVLQ